VRASAFQQVVDSFAGISSDIAEDKSLVERSQGIELRLVQLCAYQATRDPSWPASAADSAEGTRNGVTAPHQLWNVLSMRQKQ